MKVSQKKYSIYHKQGYSVPKQKNYKILENNLVEINTLPNYEAFYEKN